MEQSELITPDELAKRIRMTLSFVKKHTLSHRIPGAVHIGDQWRYRWSDIEQRIAIGEFLLPVDGQRVRKIRGMKPIEGKK